jgi:thiosulfate/3-mercaptopyruvate sulfurtransferase
MARMSDGPLIGVTELSAVPRGAVTLLDVRWSLTGPPGIEDYRAGHLPGARFTDLDTVLAAPPNLTGSGPGGRHPLPSGPDFQAAVRALGVSHNTPVVVYDAGDATAAARAWWLLRHFGHRDVRVLDGGYAAWIAAGQSVETAGTDDADPPAGDFTAVPGAMPVLDASAAARLAAEGMLLDARAGARYRGEVEPVDPVAGHIPGAVSAPTSENVRPDGTFRPTGELRARFAALGVPGESAASQPTHSQAMTPSVGVYCGSGVTAAHEVLALALAGHPAALYPGSWSEWVSDPARPVAIGAQPGN